MALQLHCTISSDPLKPETMPSEQQLADVGEFWDDTIENTKARRFCDEKPTDIATLAAMNQMQNLLVDNKHSTSTGEPNFIANPTSTSGKKGQR